MLNETIIEIRTVEGEKTLAFVGYGYYADTEIEAGKPYRFVEYSDLSVPLSVVLECGDVNKWEDDHAEDVAQYITDCTLDEALAYYKGIKRIAPKALSETIEDGTYILGRFTL